MLRGSARIDRQRGAASRYARLLHGVRSAAGLIDDDNSRLSVERAGRIGGWLPLAVIYGTGGNGTAASRLLYFDLSPQLASTQRPQNLLRRCLSSLNRACSKHNWLGVQGTAV